MKKEYITEGSGKGQRFKPDLAYLDDLGSLYSTARLELLGTASPICLPGQKCPYLLDC